MPRLPYLTFTFPKSVRLARSSEFLRVKTEGRSWSGRFITLGVLRNTEETKAGIITSKKVGGAVVRNRVRRRLREILRLTRPEWCSHLWVVVIARHAASSASFDELKAEWFKLAKRGGVLPRPPETPPKLAQESPTDAP